MRPEKDYQASNFFTYTMPYDELFDQLEIDKKEARFVRSMSHHILLFHTDTHLGKY